MMKGTRFMHKAVALLLGGLFSLPAVASAEKARKSPLTDAPVVRRRLELRDKRLEFGVGTGVSIGQDFYNALLVMPKLSYHINDWLSIAGVFGYNVLPNWKSSFNSDIGGALPAPGQPTIKSPFSNDAVATMNHIGYTAIGQVEFIPLSGKIAILSTLFSYFDFYVLAGAGIVNLAASKSRPASCNPLVGSIPQCQAYTATQLTGNAGLGAHAFLSRYFALNLEIRDLIYKNNASGRDVNGDKVTNSNDLRWEHNWIFSLNLQFFAPFKAKISR
jgi:outer membrane beta-barrel protein